MYKSWNSFGLCKFQYRETGITTNTNHSIGFKLVNDFPDLEKTFYELKWQTNVFYQRTSIESCDVQSFYMVSCLGHFFHFHFSFRTHKQNFDMLISFLQGISNCYGRENMTACSPTRYNYFFVHRYASLL